MTLQTTNAESKLDKQLSDSIQLELRGQVAKVSVRLDSSQDTGSPAKTIKLLSRVLGALRTRGVAETIVDLSEAKSSEIDFAGPLIEHQKKHPGKLSVVLSQQLQERFKLARLDELFPERSTSKTDWTPGAKPDDIRDAARILDEALGAIRGQGSSTADTNHSILRAGVPTFQSRPAQSGVTLSVLSSSLKSDMEVDSLSLVLTQTIRDPEAAKQQHIQLDLSRVNAVSKEALVCIFNAQKELKGLGGSLSIIPSQEVSAKLSRTHLDKHLMTRAA